MKRNSQQGVALVITLILLSVITFMAVTFLVVSRREGGQVNTIAQQTNAKLAAEAGVEQAKAQIIAQILGSTNGLSFGMFVSTNYIGSNYVSTGPLSITTALTNVSYNITGNAATLEQMLNNLLILPRPPVFIYTNKTQTAGDFRFWLDLNRNGRYDQSGLIVETDTNGTQIPASSQNPAAGQGPLFLPRTGDPEWIGVLNRPEYRHSASNFFVGRYAFIALPIGNSLDLNFIHNQAKQITGNMAGIDDGYNRNQGVGTWEINLAGFLHALSTNIWPGYKYSPTLDTTFLLPSTGESFYDAAAIVQYRFNRSYANVNPFYRYFQTAAPGSDNGASFIRGYIDPFAFGANMTNFYPAVLYDATPRVNNRPWPGSDNPAAFFTTQDLFGNIPFNGGNAALSFTNRLVLAGQSKGTAERYAYYRLLSQLSFASAAEPAPAPYTNRINLNYNNLGTTNNAGVFHTLSATNFVHWTPQQFFTNAADRMLRTTFPNPIFFTNADLSVASNFISITNIPLYPANLYTPALHRVLQLAANIYDATTNRQFNTLTVSNTLSYPSVFRPTFSVRRVNGTTNIFINGYVEVGPTATDLSYLQPSLSLQDDLASIVTSVPTNIYGVPWVIGAKKGFPNFNEFTMQTLTSVQRKVQIVKPSQMADTSTWVTNIQYNLTVSNLLGVEAWNSYASAYPRKIFIGGMDRLTMYCTNDAYDVLMSTNVPSVMSMTINPNQWTGFPGSINPNANRSSFQIPLSTNVIFAPNLIYHPFQTPKLNTNPNFDSGLGYILPQFGLNITNKLTFYMIDLTDGQGRIIDYVQFDGMNYSRNLTSELPGPTSDSRFLPFGDGGVWDTNRYGGPTGRLVGVENQIEISTGVTNTGNYPPFLTTDWLPDRTQQDTVFNAMNTFREFMAEFTAGSITNLVAQVPYSPIRNVSVVYSWQANDPLVHYTLSDLTSMPLALTIQTNWPIAFTNESGQTNMFLPNLGVVNTRYLPWGNIGNNNGDLTNKNNMMVKDSFITRSDDWQFPTNAFPNIGWLGRVHRGTPWQTVYLKSAITDLTNWMNWTGNLYTNNYGFNDLVASQPSSDWQLLDLFTTAPDENATRGQLSINQTNLEAWSAIFNGVYVISNASPSTMTPLFIDPASVMGSTNVVRYLVNAINTNRAAYPSGVFTSLGQICSVPQLTMQSPFINTSKYATAPILRDEVYERIPQQILSLLRVGSPRYVIFAYGQSLKPADRSIVQSQPFFGMCTNYQITGEMATRTVVRIENYPIPGKVAGTAPRAVVESFNVLAPE